MKPTGSARSDRPDDELRNARETVPDFACAHPGYERVRFTCQTARLRRRQQRVKLRRPVSLRRRVRRLFLSPPDMRGWRARGRCRRRFSVRTSLRRCGSASRRATRTSRNARALLRSSWCRFAQGRRRNHSAPGRALRFGAVSCRSCPAVPWPLVSSHEPAGRAGRRHTPQPSASSWRAARIGRRAEPRRRPSAWEERSSPARGRRIRLHHQTPLDDAPR